MPSLNEDIEQAVQHAIGLANNVLDVAAHTTARGKKSKKRQIEGDYSLEALQPKKKKKKKQQGFKPSGNELPEIIAGGSPFASGQLSPSGLDPNIDPSLQNVLSNRSTEDIVADLLRTRETGDSDAPEMLSLSDLFGDQGESSESLLRVLSELDLPKLSHALQNLTTSGPSMPTLSVPTLRVATSLPVTSTSHVPMPRMPKARPASKPTQRAAILETQDIAHEISSKWLSAAKLNELGKAAGIEFKKGKFSSYEDGVITEAIDAYQAAHNLSADEMRQIIKKDRSKKGARDPDHEGFWFELTAKLELRPVIAVYHHVRRMYDEKKHKGKWLPDEDTLLEDAVNELGPRWEDISERVGRTAGDCRDRWRNHINNKETRVSGAWSEEEERLLTQIVHSMTLDRGVSADNDVFWNQVSAKMGNRRTRQQCRIKWYDALNKKVKNEGVRPRWSALDSYILIHKVASMGVNDESEIDWKLLSDEDWNLWSAHQLQRRFKYLLNAIDGHDKMQYPEILEILKAKQGDTPPVVKSVRKPSERRPNISREYVEDDEADSIDSE